MKKKLLLLLILILPSVLLGDDYQGTIYAWGYGDLIKNALEAIRALIDNNGLSTIFKVAMGIAFLLFTFQKAVNDRLNPAIEFGKSMLLFTAIWYLFLTAPNDAKHRYLIQDRVTGDTYVVEQVPTGIGEPLSLITTLEDKIIAKMEEYFSLPNSLTYRNSGLGFPLQAHSVIRTTSVGDIYLIRTINDFIENCTMYEIADGSKNINDLITSNDLVTALDPDGDTRLTKYYSSSSPDGEVMSCKDVYPKIKDDISNDVTNLTTLVSNLLKTNPQLFQQRADQIAQLFFNVYENSRSYLQQSYIINLTKKAFLNVAKATGLDPNQVAYGSAVAEQTMKNQFVQSGILAKEYLPIIKGVLITIIVSISWILALLAVAFNNFRYIKMYFTLLFWIMMWSPILVIINYIGDIYISKVFSSITNDTGQTLTLFTSNYVDSKVTNTLAWLGYLVWLTPLLAYSLVKASEHGFVMLSNSLSQMANMGTSSGARDVTSKGEQTSYSVRIGAKTYTDMAGGAIAEHKQFAYAGSVVSETTTTAGGQTIHQADLDNGSVVGSFNRGGFTSLKMAGATLSGLLNLTSTSQQAYADAHKHTQALENVLNNSVSNVVGETLREGNTITHDYTKGLSTDETKRVANVTSEAFRNIFSHNEQAQEFSRLLHNLSMKGGASAGFDLKIAKVKGGVEYTIQTQDGKEYTFTDTSQNALENAKRFESYTAKSISQDEKLADRYAHQISGGKEEAYRKVFSSMESFRDSIAREQQALKQWQISKVVSDTLGSNKAQLLATALMKDNMKKGLDEESAGLRAMKTIEDLANKGDIKGLYKLMNKYGLVSGGNEMANNLKDVKDGLSGVSALEKDTSIMYNTDLLNQKHHHINLSKANIDIPTKAELKNNYENINVGDKSDSNLEQNVKNTLNNNSLKGKSALELGKDVFSEANKHKQEINNAVDNQLKNVSNKNIKTNPQSGENDRFSKDKLYYDDRKRPFEPENHPIPNFLENVLRRGGVTSVFIPTSTANDGILSGKFRVSTYEENGKEYISMVVTHKGEDGKVIGEEIKTHITKSDWDKYVSTHNVNNITNRNVSFAYADKEEFVNKVEKISKPEELVNFARYNGAILLDKSKQANIKVSDLIPNQGGNK